MILSSRRKNPASESVHQLPWRLHTLYIHLANESTYSSCLWLLKSYRHFSRNRRKNVDFRYSGIILPKLSGKSNPMGTLNDSRSLLHLISPTEISSEMFGVRSCNHNCSLPKQLLRTRHPMSAGDTKALKPTWFNLLKTMVWSCLYT